MTTTPARSLTIPANPRPEPIKAEDCKEYGHRWFQIGSWDDGPLLACIFHGRHWAYPRWDSDEPWRIEHGKDDGC
jgi:hypothetical protein